MIYEPDGKAREYAYLAINHYTGCVGGCDYPCYMRDMFEKKKVQPPFDQPRAKKDVIKLTRRAAAKYAHTNKRVQLCFSTDPYQPLDEELKLTGKVLEILREFDIPFQVLTKFGTAAERDFCWYQENDLFGCTIVTTDPDWIAAHEPGAKPFIDRCGALIRAKSKGIKTWISLEPVIDAEEALKVIQYTHHFVDLYKIGKLNHAASGVDHARFARGAVELCHKYGCLYYLKESLAAELPEGDYSNTDWRIVDRSSI